LPNAQPPARFVPTHLLHYTPTMTDSTPLPDDPGHVPVLAQPVLDLLAPAPGKVILDCTVGRGGHASLIVPHLAPGGVYLGLDADPVHVACTQARLADAPVTVPLRHANFAAAPAVPDALNIDRVDGLLADLGFASSQMHDPARGMSFNVEGPLDMR